MRKKGGGMSEQKTNEAIKRLEFINHTQREIINAQREFIEFLKKEFDLPKDIHTRKRYFEVFHKNQKNIKGA
ncbi:hypothetical protein EZJ49_10020 [Bdellovibrio bacteriovorus]|uniref:hypothetical protein n=1 Tax=Bdellovibrio bacteriovorus TaxID=959 RepID=UPI0021D06F69|nr:hypothetical protein [Bdellovibrio bacteriovorus]UXR63411.1 hypothetical protein EZJ49_10020 [Bdellovibrio bacteriovorus]